MQDGELLEMIKVPPSSSFEQAVDVHENINEGEPGKERDAIKSDDSVNITLTESTDGGSRYTKVKVTVQTQSITSMTTIMKASQNGIRLEKEQR